MLNSSAIELKHSEERVEEKDQFWQDRLIPLPKDLNIGRTLKGLEKHSYRTVGKTRRLDGILPAALENT